jgi:hypothetical protein
MKAILTMILLAAAVTAGIACARPGVTVVEAIEPVIAAPTPSPTEPPSNMCVLIEIHALLRNGSPAIFKRKFTMKQLRAFNRELEQSPNKVPGLPPIRAIESVNVLDIRCDQPI